MKSSGGQGKLSRQFDGVRIWYNYNFIQWHTGECTRNRTVSIVSSREIVKRKSCQSKSYSVLGAMNQGDCKDKERWRLGNVEM